MTRSFVDYLDDYPVERDRYATLKQTLLPLRHLFQDRRVLDFGAAVGLSMHAILEMGAAKIIGVEPNADRVRQATHILDTPRLPLSDSAFDVVLANAVLEHIPPPRAPFVRELWRVLRRGGHLIINESPNKYLPVDFHTTGGLWCVPWMPCRLAHRYAIWRRRFNGNADWSTSGWRGVGYYEITKALGNHYESIPENTRLRHRALTLLGLPSSLFDPYPILIFQKL